MVRIDFFHIQAFSSPEKQHIDSPVCSLTDYFTLVLSNLVVFVSLHQGCYFCVKQYALECSRIPMGQTVNSQVNA